MYLTSNEPIDYWYVYTRYRHIPVCFKLQKARTQDDGHRTHSAEHRTQNIGTQGAGRRVQNNQKILGTPINNIPLYIINVAACSYGKKKKLRKKKLKK